MFGTHAMEAGCGSPCELPVRLAAVPGGQGTHLCDCMWDRGEGQCLKGVTAPSGRGRRQTVVRRHGSRPGTDPQPKCSTAAPEAEPLSFCPPRPLHPERRGHETSTWQVWVRGTVPPAFHTPAVSLSMAGPGTGPSWGF